MGKTKIDWATDVWNPAAGCTRISEGCRHCYAERMAGRFSDPGYWGRGFVTRTPEGGRWTGVVALVEKKLDLPLRWRKPRSIFVNSTFDLFHPALSDAARDRIFGVMAVAWWHKHIVLTKRSGNMLRYMCDPGTPRRIDACALEWVGPNDVRHITDQWPFPNIWLGVSAEDQAAADEHIPDLLATPAAVRFVSCEPMLGPIDLHDKVCRVTGSSSSCPACFGALDWVICGPETGPKRRDCDTAWVRSLRDQCAASSVPFFLKALFQNGRKVAMPVLDGREWREMPRG
jgi:protein gp37